MGAKKNADHVWRFNFGCEVPKLQPGAVIALHSRYTNRFWRMNGDDLSNIYMDGSAEKAPSEFPSDWTWEIFRVVDVGNGDIALWNPW